MRPAPPLAFLIVVVGMGMLSGVLYGLAVEGNRPLAGAIYGGCIALMVSLFERGILFGELKGRMRRWPTLLYIPVSEAAYVLLVMVGFAVGGCIAWSSGIVPRSLWVCVMPDLQTLIYALVVAGLLVFVTRVRDLLGHSVFTNLLLGRYHRPVKEERIFLFLDIVGSTSFARTHGDLRAQDYLGAIFAAIAEPVRLHGGSIDDYIGDMAMITWPQGRGLRKADCVRCVFAVLDRFDREAAEWQRRFGRVPRFHAALHGGPVVTAEIGIDRHKISYFGDVVNTTARIETLCRHLAAPVLISADLLGRMSALPDFLEARAFGAHLVKERDQPLEVFGLQRRARPEHGDVRQVA